MLPQRCTKFAEVANKLAIVVPDGDPEEDVSIVLQDGNIKPSHLVVWQRAVRQFHVDVPRRVGHDHRKLAEHRHVQFPQVALDPLQTTQSHTSPPVLPPGESSWNCWVGRCYSRLHHNPAQKSESVISDFGYYWLRAACWWYPLTISVLQRP